jgi:hypothetical protein
MNSATVTTALQEQPAPVYLSMASVALVAAVVLLYASGSFLAIEMVGGKRLVQAVLMLPLIVMAAYYWVTRPLKMLDPLVGFVAVKTLMEIVMRGEWIWVLDGIASLLALTVLLNAPRSSFEKATRVVVALAGIFATMALLQAILLFFMPRLAQYGMRVSAETNQLIPDIRHPVALLGLFGEQQYTLFGRYVARFHSFAREPSLNMVYFLLPAALAFLVPSRIARILGALMMAFCLVSLSGSIYMAFGFAAIWTVLLWFVPLRMALVFGLPLVMVGYIVAVRVLGLGPLFDAVARLAQYADFFQKGVSLTVRAEGADVSLSSAMALPLGASAHPDVPGPWLINASLEAGWLGALLLIWFLARIATQLQIFASTTRPWSADKVGMLLLLGLMSTVMVFNDYQMSNYTGIVLFGLVYRQLMIRNESPP